MDRFDEAYLFPETETKKCPIDKKMRKHTSEKNGEYEYVLWIQKLTPTVDKIMEGYTAPTAT